MKLGTSQLRFTERRALQFHFSYKLLLLFLLVLYSNIAKQIPALEAMRPAQMVATIALLTLIIERTLAWKHFEMVWPESYLLLAFVGAGALSVFNALWAPYALQWAADLAKMAAIYFLIVNVVDTVPRLRRVIWTMVLGGLFPALGALRFYTQGNVVEGRARWHGIFANPNELGYGLVVLIPLIAVLANGKRLWVRGILWGMIGIFMTTIYLTQSRGSLLGLAVVLALIGWRQRSAAMRVAMFAGLAVGLIAAAVWWTRGEGLRNIQQDTNVQQRMATYKAGFEMFMDRPMLGVGVGCSSVAWPLYAPPGAWAKHWLHIHNTFIQALAETGLLGFIPFVLFIGFAVYHAWQIGRLRNRPELETVPELAGALEISLWGFLVCGMSGGFALSWFPYMLIGLVSAAKKITDSRTPRRIFDVRMKMPRAA